MSALQRGLAVLSVVSKRGKVRVADVSEQTGLDKATIIRMLDTLVHEGFVEKHPVDATYAVTGRTIDLGRGFGPRERLADIVGPLIDEVREEFGWPTDFAVPDGDAMFIVETGKSSPMLFQRPENFRPDFLVTSFGRAYLAFCADEEQGRILDRLSGSAIPEARKLLKNPSDLRKQFLKIRDQGYATANDNYTKRLGWETIQTLSVPITDKQRVYGAIGMFFIRSSVSEEDAVRDYLPPLRTLSSNVMKKLERERASFPSAPHFVD